MKKFIAIPLLLLFSAITSLAFNIRGIVNDSDGLPLAKASIRLLAAKDSTVVNGVIANDDGAFLLSNIKKGNYLLEISYVGFLPDVRTVTGNKDLDLGIVKLRENDVMLRDLSVTGIQTPIRVAQDTVEFNADSYRTQPNAVVEDLLRRLPGVEVSSDGKITHNGRQIDKILVDGKEFFSDDPTVASRNLPVNMVDKLQVVDRKSDLARMTGVDDGEDEVVINLTVKKGMKNGWFGTAEAGYGTDSRYKVSFNVNRFWNDNQITFLGGANNVNDMGFTDGGASRFRRFGDDNGINTSQAFGINFNVGKEEIIRVGGDVMYTHTSRDTRTQLNRQYLFSDSTSFYNSNKYTLDRGNNVRGDFRIVWNPDSNNTWEFRPNLSLNFSDNESDSRSNTYAGHRGSNEVGPQVNQSVNTQDSHGKSYEFGGRLIYNHKFKSHPGRSTSIFVNYRFSNVRERSDNYSWNKFFLMADSVDLHDQYADDHTWSNTVQGRISWTEPLGDAAKGNFLEFAYQMRYRWNNADKMTYEYPVTFPDGWNGEPVVGDIMVWNDSLSNQFRNNYMNQDIRVGYKHVSKTHNLNVGISLVPQMQKSTDLINDAKSIPERWVWNYAPYMRYRLKMSQTRSMNIDYRGRSSQPSMTQLQPVADYSDPLNVVQGNPNLSPSFTHNANFRFQDFKWEDQRALMLMVMASMTQNSIISKTTYDSQTGGRFTTYENVNGVWNVNAFSMVSFPFRNKLWTFNNHLGGSYNHNVGYNNGLKNNSGDFSVFESFGIAFRPESLELELRPTYRLQYSTNSVQTTANRTVHSYGGRFSGTWYTPIGIVLSTDLNYTATSGYGAGFNKNEWMWNASISYQTLKDKSLTFKISGYDILQQRSNVQRTVNASYIQDALYNSLTRYFMFSVAYKFNTFGQGNEPKSRNQRGYGPPHGGGRPPRP